MKFREIPLRALLSAADLVQSSHTHYIHGTTPAHCATEPSLYTPLLPGLGGRLFILYVTKLIIQLLTDYRRPETRLKYINILNIMETERRRRISFSVWILQTLQSSVSTSYIYRYRICGAPHNNVYFIGNLHRRVTCTQLTERCHGGGEDEDGGNVWPLVTITHVSDTRLSSASHLQHNNNYNTVRHRTLVE